MLKEKSTPSRQSNYSITFLPENKTFAMNALALTPNSTGLPGSILDIAIACDIDIDHACGGVAACSTCHIILEKGGASCNESSEDEEDQLDLAPGLTPHSRLACQCIPNGTDSLVIRIPNWNRNLVKEK